MNGIRESRAYSPAGLLNGMSKTLMLCGFKCFKREAAYALFRDQVLNGFSFDVEILYLAQRKGFRVKEVPVMWREAKTSKIKLFRDSFFMLKELLYLRKHYE